MRMILTCFTIFYRERNTLYSLSQNASTGIEEKKQDFWESKQKKKAEIFLKPKCNLAFYFCILKRLCDMLSLVHVWFHIMSASAC